MANNLYPDAMDEEIEEEWDGESEAEFPKSVCFDAEKMDFVLNGSGQLAECDGIEAWIQWCIKALQTPRSACDAYSDDIGIDMEEIWEAEDREEAESVLESEMKEALEADPMGRTEYVQSIEFHWITTDSVEVSAEILGVDNELINVNTVIYM